MNASKMIMDVHALEEMIYLCEIGLKIEDVKYNPDTKEIIFSVIGENIPDNTERVGITIHRDVRSAADNDLIQTYTAEPRYVPTHKIN